MPRHTRFDEDDPPDDWGDDYGTADETYDPEADWSPDDEFLPGEAAEIPCPHCGATITEDHQRCPKCEMFLTKEDETQEVGSGAGFKWIVILALCLVFTVVWTLFR
jgi:predicted nucleic acid-binding Zn ribbon protein